MSTTIHDAIVLANKRFMAAFDHGDAAAVSRCYAADGQVLPPQGEPVSGPPAIEGFWRAVMGMGIKSVKLETVEVAGDTGLAYEVGRYTLAAANGQTIDRGKYIVIWRVEAGEWKLHRDIWNTSIPPAA